MPATPDVKTIFGCALQIETPDRRAAYLDEACGDNTGLRAEVDDLLAALGQAGEFMSRPAAAVVTGQIRTHDPITNLLGTLIGPYKLMEQIGEGGMGLVFVAEQQKPVRRKVALKLIKPGMDSKQVIARFEAERQALAMMDHPNIARILDAGTVTGVRGQESGIRSQELGVSNESRCSILTPDPCLLTLGYGRPYFVMELVKGLPITDYCDKSRLGTRQRLELFLDVCHAVQHAHQKGIIHRDLKPSNILVEVHDVRPVVKIIDFGISKAIGQQLTDKTLYTAVAHMVGTPMYMSPEQAGLSSLDVDTRSDVYSLGVLLYELLTGTTPFESETLKKAGYDEMRRIIREDEPPKPSTRLSTLQEAALATIAEQRGLDREKLGPELRRELDWVVMKALEKDRNRRYESASALAADVQRYLVDEPVEACPPSRHYRLGKLLRKHRNALLTATALVAAALALLAGAGWLALERAARYAEMEKQRIATEEAVTKDLEEAALWQEKEQWSAARQLLEKAMVRLSGDGSRSLREQVAGRLREVDVAARLENARLKASPFEPIGADEADRLFGALFVELGLSIEGGALQETVRRMQASPIRNQLVAALDYWALVKDALPGGHGETLRALAQSADTDDWRHQLRDPQVNKDPERLLRLAEREDVLDQPPGNLLFLRFQFERVPLPADAAAANELRAKLDTAGLQLLRQAQQRYPADFWLNYTLGRHLWLKSKQLEPAIGFLRAALALQPRSAEVHHSLGLLLAKQRLWSEAATAFRKVIDLKPDSANPYYNLGLALQEQGKATEAITAYRKALALRPDYAQAYVNLGDLLQDPREAEAAFRKALQLRGFYEAYLGLGNALHRQGKLPDSEDAYRKAIELDPHDAKAYYNLGATLRAQRKLSQAVDAYRKAIELKHDYADGYYNLGNVLADQRDTKGAEVAYLRATELRPKDADFQHSLGNALRAQGKLVEAEQAWRKAIDFQPGHAAAHWNLGVVLVVHEGKFSEGLTFLKRGHELGSRWAKFVPTAEFLRKAEHFVVLDAKLPKIIGGATQVIDAAELMALAELCQLPCRQLTAASARFYREAFAANPKLGEDLVTGKRYDAACAAALAAAGQGKDVTKLDPEEYARFRKQALAWLRADLTAWKSVLENEREKASQRVLQKIRHWQEDPDFGGVRGAAVLAELPEAECRVWQKFWADVEELKQRAAGGQPTKGTNAQPR